MASKEVVPTLEELMNRLEKSGLNKYASDIKEILAQMPGVFPGGPSRRIPLHQKPRAMARQPQIGSPMLQKGEQYTDIDPVTGKETPKNYSPIMKGVLVSDWVRKQMEGESDPTKKGFLSEMLDKAVAAEVSLPAREAAEGSHWLSEPHEVQRPMKSDPVEVFLMESLKTSKGEEKNVIQGLLDRHYKSKPATAVRAVRKCASVLRERGYEALASRLEGKVAAGIYRQGRGVRILGLPEYIAKSKVKDAPDDKNLYDEMYDKYIKVFKGVAALLEKAKTDMHDPSKIGEAVNEVLMPNSLMMEDLLEVGEITQGGTS